MSNRMDKYLKDKSTNTKRTEKNQKLYDEISDINAEYIDINNSNVFEITNNEAEKRTRSNYQKMKEFDNFIGAPEKIKTITEGKTTRVERIYDINEILKKAKEEHETREEENKKRLLNTEYNILTKLDVESINSNSDFDNLGYKKLIDDLYAKQKKDDNEELFNDLIEPKQKESELEKTVFNALNIIDKKDNNDLLQSNETEKTVNCDFVEESLNNNSEKSKEELYDEITKENKPAINSNDEDNEEDEKRSSFIIIIVIVVLIILGLGGYLFLKYFGTL